jgi:HPt (histidine-containing phosphotransfer) domain-containing protein
MEAKKFKSDPGAKRKTGKKTRHPAHGKTDPSPYANFELQTALDELKKRAVARSRKLQVIREEADRVSRETCEFLARINERIRLPMNSVIGSVVRLLETDLDADQRTYAQTISQSGSSLLRSVDDALELSKMEAGLVDIKKESFNLKLTAKNVVAEVSGRVPNTQTAFNLKYNPILPKWFKGDSKKIRHILTGMVENTITSASKWPLELYIDGVVKKDTVDLNFQVRDTGINNLCPHENNPGGLGMVITRRLVDLMGGTTDVSFEPETGTICIVQLRLDIAQGARPHRSEKSKIFSTDTTNQPVGITPEISQLIDMDYVIRLKRDFQAGLLKTLLQQYFSDAEQALRNLARVVEKRDFSKTQDLLHLLKGCSANFGASAIVKLCDRHRARLKNLQDMTKADVVDLKQTYQGTKNQLLLAANKAL